VAYEKEEKNAYYILFGNFKRGNFVTDLCRHRKKDIFKMALTRRLENVDWIHVAYDASYCKHGNNI
jgi:hypothetical protein